MLVCEGYVWERVFELIFFFFSKHVLFHAMYLSVSLYRCSSKRFILTSVPSNASMSSRDSMTASNLTPTTTVSSLPDGIVAERVCDGCYNRLSYEATQPSPDHYRVRHLKMCATDLLNSISELIDALDDPDGDPNGFNHSLRYHMYTYILV